MTDITDTQLASTTAPQGASLVGYSANASGAVGRTELAKWQEHGEVTPEDFGAVGDGTTDDYAALQAWLNALGTTGKSGKLGPKTYCHSQTLTSTAWNVTIRGAGSQTILKYNGASTTADHFVIGGASLDTQGWMIRDMVFDSATVKTAGACIHAYNLQHSLLEGVFICPGGIVAPTNVFDGLFLQGFGYVYLRSFIASGGRGTALKACSRDGTAQGTPPPAYAGWGVGLYVIQSRFGGWGQHGVHLGGGCGGVTFDHTDIINNGLITTGCDGVLIDNALVGIQNREIMFGPGCSIDSQQHGHGLHINDALANPGYINCGTLWACSSNGGHGIYVEKFGFAGGAVGVVNITGGIQYNNTGDGVRVSSNLPLVTAVGSTSRYNGGFGYNNTVGGATNLQVRECTYFGNTGANIAGSARENAGSQQAVINSLGFTPANISGDTFTGDIRRSSTFYMGLSGTNPIMNFSPNVYVRGDSSNNQLIFKANGSQEVMAFVGNKTLLRLPGPYASDAAAGAAGLTSDYLYYNSSNQVIRKA